MIRNFFRGAVGLLAARKQMPADIDPEAREIISAAKAYTMTSLERLFAVIEAVRYIERFKIPGDFVECGVWKGGSMMAAALTLKRLGSTRQLYLFDTFEGMTAPTEKDVNVRNQPAALTFARKRTEGGASDWCSASIEEVRQNMESTGYDPASIHYVKGRVEATLPAVQPEHIALLRLDTDWYESTKHELVHLYPRLSPGGVLMIDDYGHWKGSRAAADEYFADRNEKVFLHRIDYTARLVIKR